MPGSLAGLNMQGLSSLAVAIASGSHQYPNRAPFDPPRAYPEFAGASRTLDPENRVFDMVREALRLLALDSSRFGTCEWNPLGEVIAPGMRVVLKPNFVMHENYGSGPLEAVITHASVVRAIADYVLLALRGDGELIVGDAPQMNCDWDALMARNGMGAVGEYLHRACAKNGIRFSLTDFRKEQTFYKSGIVWKRKPLRDASHRTITAILGRESFMDEIDNARLYGADYGRSQTIQAHADHRHQYKIARELLTADVVISIPKLKVHSKVGTTLNIKNLVGINTDKNNLAHYRIGSSEQGGDEFSNPRWDDRLDRTLCDLLLSSRWKFGKYPFLVWRGFRHSLRVLSKAESFSLQSGNWHGNDTAWRMALDLNRIVLCADADGRMNSRPIRRYFSVIDGVVGGQGDGPLRPDPYLSGVVLAGFNPLAVDWVATTLMGIDPARIPMYTRGLEQMREWIEISPQQIEVKSNRREWPSMLAEGIPIMNFRPPCGWRGHIEHHCSDEENRSDATAGR